MDDGIALIEQKTLELCEAIVASKGFPDMFRKMDAFMGDEGLKFRFQQVNDLGRLLHDKQSHGLELKGDEIEQFESLRSELMSSAIVRDFLAAQDKVQQLHSIVAKFLDKTLELGRIPEWDDVQSGCCNTGGCGCN
jgi:cell fate (sporulation/competence/biofilm development) regulator YlbF (YheA/YmcA/DUF963 family)